MAGEEQDELELPYRVLTSSMAPGRGTMVDHEVAGYALIWVDADGTAHADIQGMTWQQARKRLKGR